ncbi:Tbc1d13 [Symbiodinium pilosum]|uniref:Tbc1d13 protein n=1 Tax=Symbiodinium pilosum TaxID=2952 RepID=A0A812TYI8_SYMPI|nr:Tbc1d13 [Symbiodinium pilosum]
MELCLLNAENIPDGCLLSVSAGGSRRQAALAPKQKFAFSNASTAAAVAAGGSGLKVDLLSVQGSACVASSELLPGLQKALGAGAGAEGNKDGHQIEVIVNPPGPHGAVEEEFTMKLNFNIKPTSKERDGAETSRLASSVNTARTDLEERHLPTDLLKQSALLDRAGRLDTTLRTKQAISHVVQALHTDCEKLAHCVCPRITDGDSPKVLEIDLNVVRPLCADGIPDEAPVLRAALWKLLLGYLPCDAFRWDAALASARADYATFLQELQSELPQVLAQEGERPPGWPDDEDHVVPLSEVLEQIRKDVMRTRPEMDFFCRTLPARSASLGGNSDSNEDGRQTFDPSEVTLAVTSRDPECIDVMSPKSHYDVLARILLLYAKLNRGVRYVQGMNELCAPLYYLFAQDPLNFQYAEADTFFCFSLLMSDMRDTFVKTMDNEEGGMMGRIDQFSELLKEKDQEVWKHLEELRVSPVYYTVPWLTLMLTQELDMADVLRLWDSLLSDLARPHPLLCYLCVAMVIGIREVLLAGDFTDCMRMLQHYPPVPVDELLQGALRLRAADRTGVGFSSSDWEAAVAESGKRSYLDDHNILNFVERVLRTLVQDYGALDRPSDPWGAIAALLPEAAAAGAMPESIKPDGPLEKLEEEREEVKQPEWNMMPSVGTWYMIPTPVAKPQKDAAPPPAEVQEMPLSTRGEEVEHERAVAGQFVEDLVLAVRGTSPMFSAAETEVGTRHQPAKQSAVAKATEACAFSNQPWHMLASVGTWYSPLRPTPATEDAPKEFQVESAEVPYQATQETEWPQLPSVGTWFTPIEELPVVHEQVVSEAAGDNVKAMEVTSAPPRPLKGTGISSSTIVAFVLPSLDFEQLVASDQSSILVEEVKAPMNQFAVRSLRVELGAAEPDGVEIRMTIKNGSSSEAKALKAQILQAEESFLAEVEQRLASAQLLPTSASFKATNLQVMVRHTASFEEGPVDGHATASTMAPAATTMYATGNAMSSAMPTESQWATTFDTSAEEPSPPALPEATEAAEEPSQPALPQEDGKLAETEDDFIPKLLLDPYAMDDGTGTSPIQSAVSDGRLRKEREEAVAAAKRRAAKAAAANIPDFLVDPYALDDGTGTSPMQSAVSDARLRQERQEAQFATIRRSAEEEFSRADANNDGVITATEFAAWAYTKDGTSEVELATVAASFQAMDANQDGVLSKEEFESYYMAKAAEELPTPSEGQVLGAEVTEAALESVAHQLLTDIAKKADDHASYASGLMSDIQEGFLQAELANALQAATNRAASSVTASIAGSAAPLGSEGSLTVAEQIAAAAMAAAAAPPSTAATDSNMSQDAFEIPLASFATLGATPTVVSIESARSPGGAPQPVMPTEDRTPSASSGPGDAKELGAEMAAKDLVTDITNEQGFLQAELADALQALP